MLVRTVPSLIMTVSNERHLSNALSGIASTFLGMVTEVSPLAQNAWDAMVVIESDIVTNFYLGSDDMEDYYKNGTLREEAIQITDEDGNALYSFGYGHGYHRFVTIAGQLGRYRDTKSEMRRTLMPESAALVILQSVVQNPYTNASGISMTQYSVIYSNAQKTLEVWPYQNYRESWVFDTSGNRN